MHVISFDLASMLVTVGLSVFSSVVTLFFFLIATHTLVEKGREEKRRNYRRLERTMDTPSPQRLSNYTISSDTLCPGPGLFIFKGPMVS